MCVCVFCLWSSRDKQAGSDREQADGDGDGEGKGEGVRGRGKGDGDPTTQGPEVREPCELLKSTTVAQ